MSANRAPWAGTDRTRFATVTNIALILLDAGYHSADILHDAARLDQGRGGFGEFLGQVTDVLHRISWPGYPEALGGLLHGAGFTANRVRQLSGGMQIYLDSADVMDQLPSSGADPADTNVPRP